MTGQIHSIQSLGTLDGPGVRCVVFLQGCPLRCVYCHNPDTWEKNGGTQMTAKEVFDKVKRYRSYFGTEGGVTVSGGEPLMQCEFLSELFELCHQEGIHTAIDTSGHGADLQSASAALEKTDLVLLDLKMTTEEAYRKNTKGSLHQTLRFLDHLQERQIPVWIRHVVVPGLTDSEENLHRLADLLQGYSCVKKVEFLPFRKLCIEKYQQLGIDFPLKETDEASEDFCRKYSEQLKQSYHP